MKKNYYYEDFFATPYEYEYPYDCNYVNFHGIPPCQLMNNESNFCPMMQRNIELQNDYGFQNGYNENMNEEIFCEDNFGFQGMRGFQPENFGPTIMPMPMPMIIDFDEDEE